jgi:hypothetical protein
LAPQLTEFHRKQTQHKMERAPFSTNQKSN